MRGAGSIVVKPREQLVSVLPAVSAALLSVMVGYIVLCAVQYAGVHSLEMQGADDRIVEGFMKDTHMFVIIFWAASAIIFLGTAVWTWWISMRIFGPLKRLENHLDAVLAGEQKIVNVRVRESDMLYSLFERINRALSRPGG